MAPFRFCFWRVLGCAILLVQSGFGFSFKNVRSQQPRVSSASRLSASPSRHDSSLEDGSMVHGPSSIPTLMSRRQVCLATLATAGGVATFSNKAIAGASLAPLLLPAPDFTVLSDLPPIPQDCVRIYLCRHGQTEYNRLKLMQGARIDAPINDIGVMQAERLGKALSQASPQPEMFFHSTLSRTRQTALVATEQFVESSTRNNKKHPIPLKVLPALAEIDFGGPVEGVPVVEVRSKMVATYSAWGRGDISERMTSDGENFTEILSRAQAALFALTNAASSCESRCIAAVAHSTYIRMLLAAVQDVSLFQMSTLEQKNCCINVIDLRMDGALKTLGPKSKLFGGMLSQAPDTFECKVPLGTVLRTGEKRHLGELAV